MDNEKYGIELELITGKFNNQMEKVKAQAKSIQKAFDPNDISGLKITGLKETISGVKTLNESLKGQVGQLANVYARQRQSIKNLGQEAEKTERRIVSLNDGFKKTGYTVAPVFENATNATENVAKATEKVIQKQNKLSVNSTKSSLNITKGLDKMTSKIKRFGLALLSIRSIYALVSRASSAYLSQDTELSDKLQAAWIGLGSILAPIINFLATLMLKLVSIVNMVIKALTGVDLMAKASAKSMKGAAGSANALKKSLAGFDELQNLDTDAGGGTGVGAGWGDAFANIDTDWAEMLKSFYDTIDEMSKNGIKKIQEAKKKAVGIMTDMGWSKITIDGYSTMMDGLTEVWEGLIRAVKGVVKIIDGILSLDAKKIYDGVMDLLAGIGEILIGTIDMAVGLLDFLVGIVWEGIKKVAKWFYDNLIRPVVDWFIDAWNKIKNKAFEIWDSIKTKIINVWNSIKSLVINIGQKAGEIISGAFKGVVNGVLNAMEKILNTPIRQINRLTDVINNVPGINLGKLNTFNLPRLDVGTNYVPQDQVAMIHKGEAVIPKKFNSKEYFGGTNDETNAILEELIQAVKEIEINPYTTIKDVGRASLSYINNKTRQLGESVVI